MQNEKFLYYLKWLDKIQWNEFPRKYEYILSFSFRWGRKNSDYTRQSLWWRKYWLISQVLHKNVRDRFWAQDHTQTCKELWSAELTSDSEQLTITTILKKEGSMIDPRNYFSMLSPFGWEGNTLARTWWNRALNFELWALNFELWTINYKL